MKIDLTVSEACYLRAMIAERRSYLNRRLGKIKRFSDSRGDRVTFQEQISMIQGELIDLSHVDKELLRCVSHSLLYAKIHGLYDIISE